MSDWVQKKYAEVMSEVGDVEPAWSKFPLIKAGSIGWRMGSGESWLWLWSHHIEQLGTPESWVRMRPGRRAGPSSAAGSGTGSASSAGGRAG